MSTCLYIIFVFCLLVIISKGNSQFLPYMPYRFIVNRPLTPFMIEPAACCNQAPVQTQLTTLTRQGRRQLKEDQNENTNSVKILKDILALTKGNLAKASQESQLVPVKEADSFERRNFNSDITPAPIDLLITPATNQVADDQTALQCSLLNCTEEEDTSGFVCACNYKTGNTVSFKNECELKKHNCRFDTGFKTILNEVCPWQFDSRTGSEDLQNLHFDYADPRYYNDKNI